MNIEVEEFYRLEIEGEEFLDNDELECLTGSGFNSFTALAEAGSYTII